MAKYLPLPDGTSFKVPNSMGFEEAMSLAKERYPDAFEDEKPARKKGILAQAGKGLESLISSGRTAGAALFGDAEEAAKAGVKRSQDIGSRYEDAADFDKVKKLYEERGILPAAGEAISQIPGAVAEQGANMASLAASGRLGSMLGGAFGTKGKLVGGALGALASGTTQALGQNVERQAAEQQKAGEPVNIDMAKAVGTAIPSGALDVAGTFIPFGGKIISKVTGIPVEALLGRSAAQVAKLAEERLAVTLSKGLATGALAEIPTEIAQQMLERYQAGLSLTDADAMKEYGQTAYQVGLLAPLGAVGRVSERSGARAEVEDKAKVEEQQRRATRLQQEQTALAQQKAQEDAAAQALEAEKQTPKYATDIGKQYDELLAQFNAQKTAIKKPGANATPVEKAEYKDAQESLKTLQAQLQEIVPEYRRTKPIREQEAEKARIAGMSPEEYALEQAQNEPKLRTTGKATDVGIADPFATLPSREAIYAQQRINLAKQQAPEQGVNGYVDYLMTDPVMAQTILENRTPIAGLTKREQALIYGGLELQLKEVAKQRQAQGRLGTGAAQQRLSVAEQEEQDALAAQRAEDERLVQEAARRDRLAPEVLALQRMKNAPSPMTENLGLFQNEEAPPSASPVFGQLQQRLQGIPLEEGTLPTAEDVGPEVEQKRVLTRVPGAEFKLRPGATAVPVNREKETEARIKSIQETQDLTPEQISALRTAFNAAPTSKEALIDRINNVLSTYKLSPEAAAFLRRAEQVIPEADATLKQATQSLANQENIAGDIVASKGLVKNVSESQGFLTLLDQQLTKIENGEEGTPRRGADRPELLKTFPPTKTSQAQASTTTPTEAYKYEQVDTGAIPGQAASVSQADQYAQQERLERTGKPGKLPGFVAQPEEEKRTQGVPGRAKVEKRAQDINKPVYRINPETGKQELVSGTIRGEGAQALPLSLQKELEPLIKLAETVRDEQAGQLSLFGAADERSRVQKAERRGIEAGPSLDIGARPDVESFQRFMNSPYVRKLKQDMKKSEKDLAPVRAFLNRALPRLKQLLKESKDTTARMSKIKNWTKFLKENGELASFQTNTDNLVLKMNNLKLDASEINARIKMYEQAKNELVKESNRAGIRARGGAPEIKLLKELDDLLALYQEAKAEYAQTKGALDLVRTQIKVLVGEQRLAELKATTDPLAKSNAAAQDEIKRLQETIRTAQAEVAEADNKVRQAEADKAQATQGAKAANVQQLEKQISDERARRWNTALSGFGDRSEATYEKSAADPDTGAAFLRTYPTYDLYKAEKSVQVRALGAAERDARERGLTADAASEVKYKNDLYNKPLLSLILELGSIDKQLAEATAKVTAARKKSGSYVGGEQNVQAFKGLGSAIRLQSRLSVRKETLENAINFMRARNVPLRKKLGVEPEVRAASIEEQDTLDQYIDQVQELGKATDRLAALTMQRDDAIKEGKTKTVAQLNEQIDKVNTEISVGTEDKAKLTLALQGRVTAGARQTTSAPGKLRAGTPESKRNAGITKQPLVEQRNIKAPSVAQAVAEANAFAEKRAAGEKNLTKAQQAAIEAERQAEFQVILERRDEELTNQLNAAKDRLTGLQARAARPPTGKSNMPSLEDIKNAELDVNDYDWERRAVRQELEAVKKELYKSANQAEIKAAEDILNEAPEAPEPKPRGRPRKVTEEEAYGETTRTEGAVEDVYFGEDDGKAAFRTVTRGPTSLQTEQVERLAERITKGWVNAPEIVVVATEADLPVRIRGQIVKADRAEGTTPGLFDTKTKKVYLIASNLSNANDVILTIAHEAAGHYGLRELLGDKYTGTMNSLYQGNPEVRKQADAKLKADKSLSREIAVEEVLAEMAEDPNPTPAEKSALRQIYERLRAWLRSVIGLPNITDAEVQQLVANARRYVIQGGVAGQGQAPVGETTYRTKAQYGQDDALTSLSKQIIAQPKSFSQRLGSHFALETEMNLVDMRAGLREALKAGAKEMGDTKNFVQAMYSVTKSDQKMAVVSATLMNGPMELYTDDKGFHGIKSSNKNSAKDVFDAIGRIPGGNARGRVDLATTYMIAQRAANKGLSKLDVGALGISEADLQAAMADVNANPKLKDALEVVRSTYNAYNAGLIRFLASTGAIPKQLAEDLLKSGDYVPFYRINENGMADLVFSDEVTINIGDIRHQPYLAELKGGETRILPLTESLPRNTLLITDKALTNLATKNVAYAFQAIGAGKGGVDKEGKPTNAMPIHMGKAPAGADIIKFNQEPDPSKPNDTGDRWLRVKTGDTIMDGIPAELIVKSLEGAHLTLPAFLKIGGIAGDFLRSGVTRMPIYIARQLVRDPMAASFTGGLNYNPLTAVVKAGREFVRMSRGTSAAGQALIEKGLIQSGIFTGDPDDIAKMALQLAGNNQGAIDQLFAGMDRAAMRADAATRALVYENALKNGLSEVEADMATMESMNFYKRGLSPTVQYASRLIPFFNAQIQGLNVLYKAATGKMPFEEQQKIKQKFFNNAMLLVATGVVYAMAMEDDEYYKRAKPKDKYSNFFIPVPGVEEPFKLPIPYEAGWFFSLAVAAVDGMKAETDGKQQFDALRDMFLQSVPGYTSRGMPQIVKPAFEVWTNKNFYTGNDIESSRMQDKTVAERFSVSTTEAAKAMSKALPLLSPVQIEHISNGYFGQLPLIIAAAANGLFRKETQGEAPEKRITDMPFIGSSFQKKYGGADADVMYRMAKESKQAKDTYDSMLKQGRAEDAREFLADNRTEIVSAGIANQYRTQMGRLRTDEERITGMAGLSGEEKRKRIDRINDARQNIAEKFEAAMKRIEASGKT